MKALIFAAGIGSRLKPFTLHHPKALAEVGGKPLLQHVVERLRDEGGIREMVVNVHHFPDQIRDFIAANANFGIDVQFSDESSELLDTGGGLLKAWELLDPAPDDAILLHNADILTDFPIAEFVDNHIHSGRDVSLLVQRRQSSRMLWLDKNARLRGWQNMNSGECRPSGFIPASSAMERGHSAACISSVRRFCRISGRMPILMERSFHYTILPRFAGRIADRRL